MTDPVAEIAKSWGFKVDGFSRKEISQEEKCRCCQKEEACECTFGFTSGGDKDNPNISYTYMTCSVHKVNV